jgi:hypothetical protein
MIIRLDKAGSRQRVQFMKLLAEFLHRETGEWCDEEIRVFTEAVFDCDVTTAMVRSASRAPTRPGRKSKLSIYKRGRLR